MFKVVCSLSRTRWSCTLATWINQTNRMQFYSKSLFTQKSHLKSFKKEDGKKSENIFDENDEGDVFGTLSKEKADSYHTTILEKIEKMDLEEEEDHIRLSEVGRKRPPIWYGRKIESLAKEGKISEAIDLLQTKMIQEDRVMPTPYVFTTLIGALGRVGYTQKAFKLFNQMKKMGIEPEDPTYTGLFNACANSPWKEDGLHRAKLLHSQLREKEIDMNIITYHSLIKAYGKCGDLLLAFGVVDEMMAHGIMPRKDTFSFLLIAAISDKEAGMKHAIEVWRRLRKKKGQFEVYHYNLLLRAVRDCRVGDAKFAEQLIRSKPLVTDNEEEKHNDVNILPTERDIKQLASSNKGWWNIETDNQLMPVGDKTSFPVITQSQKAVSIFNQDVPNLLNPRAKFHDVVSLSNLDTPVSRLALLGGLPGILSHMAADGTKPDIKTFTLLLELIPSERYVEEDLMVTMNQHRVELDIDFINLLIRRRNLRNDKHGVIALSELISSLRLVPNVQTFGCLAMGCRKKGDADQLLKDMESLAIIPNVEIMNILAYQANMDFSYRLWLLKTCDKYEIKPEKQFVSRMERAILKAKRWVVNMDRGKMVWDEREEKRFRRDFKAFMVHYKPWLKRTEMTLETHPWAQYSTQRKQEDSQ